MALHGGRFVNYYSRDTVTHIICSNLTDAKVKIFERERCALSTASFDCCCATRCMRQRSRHEFMLLSFTMQKSHASGASRMDCRLAEGAQGPLGEPHNCPCLPGKSAHQCNCIGLVEPTVL